MEPEDVTLVSFKPYTLPAELPYPPFMNGTTQFDLWELFPTAEQGATLLKDAPDFLKGKAVLLFLELKKESSRNCSLNDCDDRGSEVTVSVRRLLIDRAFSRQDHRAGEPAAKPWRRRSRRGALG